MAQKNIVVAENGIQGFALFPSKKDGGTRTTLDAKASAAVRAHVKAFVEADERDLSTYTERLASNKRIGMRGNNKMVAGIRAIIKGEAPQAPEKQERGWYQRQLEEQKVAGQPTVEQAMAEAEKENARRDSLSAKRRAMLEKELAKHGLKMVKA